MSVATSREDRGIEYPAMTLTKITAKDFRCFRDAEARLAPLTLLMGDNGSGKTSFLALVRAVLDSIAGLRLPDFREPPYDLGTFSDLVHDRGARGDGAKTFSASFEARPEPEGPTHTYSVTFEERAAFAVPSVHRFASGEVSLEENETHFVIETTGGAWNGAYRKKRAGMHHADGHRLPPWMGMLEAKAPKLRAAVERLSLGRSAGETSPDDAGLDGLLRLLDTFAGRRWERPYCTAPIRMRPLRTYEPLKSPPDPEGEHAPTFLADLSARDPQEWNALREHFVSFGARAGLFDEFRVEHLTRQGGPFHIQVRKHARRRKGPWRHLADAGYGVSQALPLLTELHREDGAERFLLQQPEAHLHPRAQAELGSLLCRVAASGRQVIVETHSDHLMDRVRMEVRDGTTKLTPSEVSLLHFERGDREVTIHSIRFDRLGNVQGAPPGYRKFFLDELDRSIGM